MSHRILYSGVSRQGSSILFGFVLTVAVRRENNSSFLKVQVVGGFVFVEELAFRVIFEYFSFSPAVHYSDLPKKNSRISLALFWRWF